MKAARRSGGTLEPLAQATGKIHEREGLKELELLFARAGLSPDSRFHLGGSKADSACLAI